MTRGLLEQMHQTIGEGGYPRHRGSLVITHGHEDHLGALPWVIRELGDDVVPVVFGRRLTAAMAKSKFAEHKLKTPIKAVQPGDVNQAGPFSLEFIHLTHSIPDAGGVAITTPLGTVFFTGDYRFDQTPVDGKPADMARLAELGRDNLLLLCGDSTNADRAGNAKSESTIGPELENVFGRCRGRIVVTTFASNIHRVQQVADAAHALDRKLCLMGRSMVKNVNIGRELGHIKIAEGQLVDPGALDKLDDDRVVIMSTGSQGEPLAALRRMAYQEHRQVRLKEGDTIVFSANPVPGNERAVNETIDRLFHIGCDVITAADEPIHTSGHGHREELKLMLNLTRPRYLLPVHGDFKRIRLHAELAEVGRYRAREHLPRREWPAARDRRETGRVSASGSMPARCCSMASSSVIQPRRRCEIAAASPSTGSFSSLRRCRLKTATRSPRRR